MIWSCKLLVFRVFFFFALLGDNRDGDEEGQQNVASSNCSYFAVSLPGTVMKSKKRKKKLIDAFLFFLFLSFPFLSISKNFFSALE